MALHRFESMKVLAHRERIEHIRAGLIPNPVQWIVYPSNRCNLNCGHCIMKDERSGRELLDNSTMYKIPLDAASLDMKTVIFSGGGEPLLHPLTVPTSWRLKELGIKVGINTNGLLLDDMAAFDFTRVSVDAATRETYHKVKGVDAWDKLNENLMKLKRHGTLGLAFLVTPENWTEIRKFCAWSEQFKPDFLHIRPAFYDDERAEDLRKAMGQAWLHYSDVGCYKNVFFRTDKFAGFWTPRNYEKCRATPLIAVLAADGRFIVCQDVFTRFGDYNTQDFNECWWGDEHKKVLENIDINKCPRCVENKYNEVIEHWDKLEVDLL